MALKNSEYIQKKTMKLNGINDGQISKRIISSSFLLVFCAMISAQKYSFSDEWMREDYPHRINTITKERINKLSLDTITLREMKNAFLGWAKGVRPLMKTPDTLRIWKRDPIVFFESDADGKRSSFPLYIRNRSLWDVDGVSPCYWSLSPALRKGDSCILCLAQLPDSDVYGSLDLAEKLKKSYGELPPYGIPARHVTDTFAVAGRLEPYGPYEVVNYLKLFCVNKGVVTRTYTLSGAPFKHPAHRGALGEEQHRYTDQARGLRGRHGSLEMKFLSYALRPLLVGPSASYGGRENFSLLVYVDGAGRAALHVLLPENLTAEEAACTDRLKQAFDRLPPFLFGHMICADGRILPGRFLKGTYHAGSGEWSFEDYLYSTHF